MAKAKKDCFVVELKLIIDSWQTDILLRRFEIAQSTH